MDVSPDTMPHVFFSCLQPKGYVKDMLWMHLELNGFFIKLPPCRSSNWESLFLVPAGPGAGTGRGKGAPGCPFLNMHVDEDEAI